MKRTQYIKQKAPAAGQKQGKSQNQLVSPLPTALCQNLFYNQLPITIYRDKKQKLFVLFPAAAFPWMKLLVDLCMKLYSDKQSKLINSNRNGF